MTQNSPGKDRFQQAYEGTAPWDIGKPQPVSVDAAEQIIGSILSCGPNCPQQFGLCSVNRERRGARERTAFAVLGWGGEAGEVWLTPQ